MINVNYVNLNFLMFKFQLSNLHLVINHLQGLVGDLLCSFYIFSAKCFFFLLEQCLDSSLFLKPVRFLFPFYRWNYQATFLSSLINQIPLRYILLLNPDQVISVFPHQELHLLYMMSITYL